ncbi:uncharacterized protein [Haliotis asinina]|uniref:uncharacterized protein n=1 Tax=Haliotis asinina TaxID=109174 RepID=UPI003531EA03
MFFQRNSEHNIENRQDTWESEENNQPVQNETGVIHDMGLRLRIRKGEPASESRPRTFVKVDQSGCDPEADRLNQGSNIPAASTIDAAVSPHSISSCALPLVDEGDNDGEWAIPSVTRPTGRTIPLTPINKSATSALAVLGQNNSPSQLSKPPASQPTSDSCTSLSPTMHVPTSNTSFHLDSHVHSVSAAIECEGVHPEDPPSQTKEPIDDSGPSALVLYSEDENTSDTPPAPLTGLKEVTEAEGITAGDTSHACSSPETNDILLKSDNAVGKVSPEEGSTAAWKDSPVHGPTFTQIPPVVAAAVEGQILKTKDSAKMNLKPEGPDSLGKPASSRLQISEPDISSSAGPTLWTGEARETDKDVHDPTSSSSNGAHNTSTQPLLVCAESDQSSSAASEAVSSQVGLSSELPEEDKVHSKPDCFPSDTVD